MSSEIKHKREFTPDANGPQERQAKELAAAYSRLFATDDGKRVLKDLMQVFDPLRPRFYEHSDTIQAAKIDGQCDVLRGIQRAIAAGTSITGIPTPTP